MMFRYSITILSLKWEIGIKVGKILSEEEEQILSFNKEGEIYISLYEPVKQ